MSRSYRNLPRQGLHILFMWAVIGVSLSSPPFPTAQAGEEPKTGADDAEIKLGSPHETMLSFVNSMVAYRNLKKAKEVQAADKHIVEAMRCMDLKGAGIEKDLEKKYAEYLMQVLDRFWFYGGEDVIPADHKGTRYEVKRKRKGKTRTFQVIISRQASGDWLFDKDMLLELKGTWAQVIGWDPVPNVVAEESLDFGDWIELQVPDSLKEDFFFLKFYQWIGLVILIIIGFVLDTITCLIIKNILLRWLERNKIDLAKLEGQKVERPFGLAVMSTLWWVGLYWLNLPLPIHKFLSKIALFFMAFSVVWAAYRLVDLICAYLAKLAEGTESKMDDLLVPLVRKILKVVVVVFGMVFIADNLGVNVGTMLAGLGIGGVAFAFASKDTVENLFGSLTVLLDHPFNIGDWVVVDGLEGTVEEVGFRSTRIRTFYNSLVTVPNSKFVNANVDNYGARIKRRIKCYLGVTYGTPPEKVEAFCQGIRVLILQHPYTRKDYFHVYFNQFGPSSLDILLYAFVEVPDWATELREKERLFLDIMRLAENLGIGFAFPTQSIHIESQAEPRMPPTPPELEIDRASSVGEARTIGSSVATGLSKGHYQTGGAKPHPVKFEYDPEHPADRAGSAGEGE